MPTYVYQVILPPDEDPEDAQVFEVVQKMSDPPLTHHPTSGLPVRRLIQPPNLPKQHTATQEKKVLSNENLSRQGFTKYEKTDDGQYVRTAGTQGPKTLSNPDQAVR
jgi:hypothetical protein